MSEQCEQCEPYISNEHDPLGDDPFARRVVEELEEESTKNDRLEALIESQEAEIEELREAFAAARADAARLQAIVTSEALERYPQR